MYTIECFVDVQIKRAEMSMAINVGIAGRQKPMQLFVQTQIDVIWLFEMMRQYGMREINVDICFLCCCGYSGGLPRCTLHIADSIERSYDGIWIWPCVVKQPTTIVNVKWATSLLTTNDLQTTTMTMMMMMSTTTS